jgi:hypothetical protein
MASVPVLNQESTQASPAPTIACEVDEKASEKGSIKDAQHISTSSTNVEDEYPEGGHGWFVVFGVSHHLA